MRKWSIDYVDWRMTTAYPGGWRYALRHPVQLIKDLRKYIIWCQKIDNYNRN